MEIILHRVESIKIDNRRTLSTGTLVCDLNIETKDGEKVSLGLFADKEENLKVKEE